MITEIDNNKTYIINELTEYMFNKNNITNFLRSQVDINNIEYKIDIPIHKNSDKPSNKPSNKLSDKPSNNPSDKSSDKSSDKLSDKSSNKSNDGLFIPEENDSLFWCFYIIYYGIDKYYVLHNKNILLEKQIKIEYVELLRKHKSYLKLRKIDSLTNLESKLVNDKTIDINTFIALSVVNTMNIIYQIGDEYGYTQGDNMNIIYVDNKIYYELVTNEYDKKFFFIIYKIGKKYGYKQGNIDEYNKITTTLLKMDNITKPLKGISTYKVDELKIMCEKLGLEITNKDTNKKKNKGELYETLFKYF